VLITDDQDEKPIQTINLGHGVSIEHTYEESQIQGSWKIVSDQEVRIRHGDKLVHVCVWKGAR
jgi:hypothetical protein